MWNQNQPKRIETEYSDYGGWERRGMGDDGQKVEKLKKAIFF